jgi:2-dehydro-3-deoxyphosphooctonate aldolase (KDO 8-P synthase)
MDQIALHLNDYVISNNKPLILIAGPCQMESRHHAMEMAEALTYIAKELSISLIFKTSFDKANRTSISGKRGIGMKAALPIFEEIRETFNIPVITDVHLPEQCDIIAKVVDVLQIPAFLCRQTDLLIAAAKTGKIVNVKKGQFLAPWDMQNVAKKISAYGSEKIMLTERGACFGYNSLITDIRGLAIMKETGYPVIFDATHSVMQPGGRGSESGGERRFVSVLAKAAVTVGIAGVFLETHQDPDNAPSDGPSMVHLKDMPKLVSDLIQLDSLAKSL